jgi:hypothetical protein
MDIGYLAQASELVLERLSSFASISSLGSTSSMSTNPDEISPRPLLIRFDDSASLVSSSSSDELSFVTALQEPIDPPEIIMGEEISVLSSASSTASLSSYTTAQDYDSEEEEEEEVEIPKEKRKRRKKKLPMIKRKNFFMRLIDDSQPPRVSYLGLFLRFRTKGDGQCWVERFYLNRKRERVTYFRSMQTDVCYRHEPPDGASRVIYIFDVVNGLNIDNDERKCMTERLDNIDEVVKNMIDTSLDKKPKTWREAIYAKVCKRSNKIKKSPAVVEDSGVVDVIAQEPYVTDSFNQTV